MGDNTRKRGHMANDLDSLVQSYIVATCHLYTLLAKSKVTQGTRHVSVSEATAQVVLYNTRLYFFIAPHGHMMWLKN